MKTEINILIGGAWVSLDLFAPSSENAAEVAMTYGANDLGEFEERAGDYSLEVEIPRSPRNMDILGLSLLPCGRSDEIPWQSYEVEVLEGGVPIVERGARLEILRLEDTCIAVQVVGNAVDLADTLEGREMVSEEGDGFQMVWSAKNMQTEPVILSNGVQLHWCAVSMGETPNDLNNPAMAPSDFITTPARAFPFLNFWGLVRWIFEKEGWTLDAEGADVMWNAGSQMISDGALVGCVNNFAEAVVSAGRATGFIWGQKEYNLLWQNASAESPTGYFQSEGQYSYIRVEQSPQGFANATPNKMEFLALTGGTMVVGVDGMLNITYDDDGSGSVSGVLMVLRNGTEVERWTIPVGSQFKDAVEIEVEAGDVVSFGQNVVLSSRATGDHGDIVLTAVFEFEYQTWLDLNADELTTDKGPIVGATYDLLRCLGFDNRLEVVQEFMRLQGLSLVLDMEGRVAKMYTMKEVRDNANEGGAVDWSKKLIKGGWEFDFAPEGYAKKNTLQFAENESEGFTDSYILEIDNTALDEEKEVFTSKFLSVRGYVGGTINIPLYSYDSESGVAWKGADAPVLAGVGNDTLRVALSEDEEEYEVDLRKLQPIGMQWFAENMYGVWFDMLRKWRGAEAVFMLDAADVGAFDVMKPVYIEAWGRYWYVREIQNYVGGGATTVQLVMIK